MDEYQIKRGKRRLKQIFSGLAFIILLSVGWHYPLLGFFIPLCMLFGIGMAFWRGRKWCDWFCPRGSFYDAFTTPLSSKAGIPTLFKNMYFRVSVLTALLAVMAFNLGLRWPDMNKIGLFFIIMLTATIVLGVILALIFHPRSWCSFCPIGTLANLSGKGRHTLKIDSESCVECKLCAKACPIGIKPYLYKKTGIQPMTDKDCLKCGLCVAVCPKKALAF
ncbi:MAG: 4Fe-4S binding protein [Candidatus Omnitrophica bacterium]|nr:4Fe-4S binding protein [Candidatus Omnitrophota bacterium]